MSDRPTALLTHAVRVVVESEQGGFGIGDTRAGIVEERRDLLPFERDGVTFRVVLVVVRAVIDGRDDVVQLLRERGNGPDRAFTFVAELRASRLG